MKLQIPDHFANANLPPRMSAHIRSSQYAKILHDWKINGIFQRWNYINEFDSAKEWKIHARKFYATRSQFTIEWSSFFVLKVYTNSLFNSKFRCYEIFRKCFFCKLHSRPRHINLYTENIVFKKTYNIWIGRNIRYRSFDDVP